MFMEKEKYHLTSCLVLSWTQRCLAAVTQEGANTTLMA